MIWATRGRDWGSRFLENGGYDDPLPVYLEAFSEFENSRSVFHKANGKVALRFEDPEGRQDSARRPIMHDFVLEGISDGASLDLETTRDFIWPFVAEEFARVWDQPEPPR